NTGAVQTTTLASLNVGGNMTFDISGATADKWVATASNGLALNSGTISTSGALTNNTTYQLFGYSGTLGGAGSSPADNMNLSIGTAASPVGLNYALVDAGAGVVNLVV